MNQITSNIRYFLSVPYLAEFEAIEDSNGDWWYQAEYPELGGTKVRCRSIIEAVNELERLKFEVITSMLEQGELPPVPRPPLRSGVCGFRDNF